MACLPLSVCGLGRRWRGGGSSSGFLPQHLFYCCSWAGPRVSQCPVPCWAARRLSPRQSSLRLLLAWVCEDLGFGHQLLEWPSWYPGWGGVGLGGSWRQMISFGTCWFALALWALRWRSGVLSFRWVFDSGTELENSLISQNLVNHSELRGDPRCEAALVVYRDIHLPAEKDLCLTGGSNAHLRLWEPRMLIPVTFRNWEGPVPASYWFYAQ